MSDERVSRSEFSQLVERGLAEVDAGLRSASRSQGECASTFTLQDWWEYFAEVVMPDLILGRSREG